MDRAQLIQSFQAHNRVQREYFIQALANEQQLVIQLLPLLLHTNHPDLPGFTGDECPAGIVDYQTDTLALKAANRLHRGFNYRRKAQRRYAFHGLYCLPDGSALNPRNISTLTVWLVYQADLSADAITLLTEKLDLITRWAQSMGLQLNMTAVSQAALRKHPSVQPQLESFYLNGLVLAGSLPMWWSITVEEQADYANIVAQIQERRGAAQNVLLDFGLAEETDADTLFHRTYGAWMRALSADVEAIFTLYFLQQQLQYFPQHLSLSTRRKAAIMAGETNTLAVDWATLMLNALADNEQLEAIRQTFYLLGHEKLSSIVHYPAFPQRRQFYQKLVAEWHWSAFDLQQLDQAETLQYRQRLRQQQTTLQQLLDQLPLLTQFAQRYGLKVAPELAYAKRLLALKRRPAEGVIEELPCALKLQNGYEQLFIHRFATGQRWYLNDIALTLPQKSALHTADNLLRLLAIAVRNGLLDKTTRLRVADQQQKITANTVLELSQIVLRSNLAATTATPDITALNTAASVKQLLLFANLQQKPPDKLEQQGLQMSSLQNDPLRYSSAQINLVDNLDLLVLSSWGQWHHLQFKGEDAVVACLATLLRWQPQAILEQASFCWCFTPIFGQAITQRLHQLLTNVVRHQQQWEAKGRFFLRLGKAQWQIDWQHDQVETLQRLPTDAALKLLNPAAQQFVASKLDERYENAALINRLLAFQSPQKRSVFLDANQQKCHVWLLDLFGNLSHVSYPQAATTVLADNLFSFFAEQPQNMTSVQCYQIQLTATTPHIASLETESLTTGLSAFFDINHAALTLNYKQAQFSAKLSDNDFDARLSDWLTQQQLVSSTILLFDNLVLEGVQHPPDALRLQTKLQLELRINRLLQPAGLVL